eukprot:TRINITY_DN876_c0_g1_i3.p1 TRINITY_DN876_c0_g1~~TRINITY_DN876_c0_g1_i3.p1  ORF type:complete len:134 (-),score=28.48 TRINITY_DN876_c0_g1_i3:273-674(-)
MFQAATHGVGSYDCYLSRDRRLPFVTEQQAVEGITQLLQADPDKLSQRIYNVNALSFTPVELATELATVFPGFSVNYNPDTRDRIAESWPESLADGPARKDWGWAPDNELNAMCRTVLERLQSKIHKAAATIA